ncbi:MAG TPA: RsfA family transcriptional regulator [Pseudogracilibacillus sp.]|nr:RsfA family transcriptional regulator [Pseudogracilibacillus sp.]
MKNKARQDAWSKEEDLFLAETVLEYIGKGKTQLEAFEKAGQLLSRTSAACGYRWNATVRKRYDHAVAYAKNNQKINFKHDSQSPMPADKGTTIDSVITLLEQMKSKEMIQESQKDVEAMEELTEVNNRLQEKIKRYEEAWREMGKLWQWIHQKETSTDEHG